MENKFIDGCFLEAPKENAPTFLKGKININIEKFIPYLKANAKEGKWVNLDLLETRDGRLYLKLNEYKPKKFNTETERIASQNSDFISIDDIPL